ncbi:hypothetical protein [Accumulibacter sp.]|uniref:hypothetical protein n=1 Tax=Accumulibacter sp. TaxID=2053492 RepID=UPI0028C3FB96|nr:hypothetical protein [Accumulibacter sp.]
MSKRRRLTAAFVLSFLAAAVLADQLPPAPSELGNIRRNAQGQLEVIRAPAERPSAAAPAPAPGPASTAAGVTAGVRESAQAKTPEKRMASTTAPGRTIVVGPLEAVRSIEEAARIARDGDTIEIRPGEYRQQAVVWTQGRLTIRGTGKRPRLIADGASAEGKALWVVRNGDLLIENLEFRGARVADGNGAGIRFERGHLRVVRCAFFDNEMGILTGNVADTVLEVEDSEFGEAPKHAGALHHLLYAGTIARLSVKGSRFQQGYLGHLIKSRARESRIFYNLLVDGAGGRASYELEFPNGGLAWVIGNIIGQSETSDNVDLISYGAEGKRWPDNALYLAHNTLIDDLPAGNFLHVWLDRMPPGFEVWAINNLVAGYGRALPKAPGRYAGNQIVEKSELSDGDGLPFRLSSHSPLRGKADLPGFVREQNLAPTAEFMLPAGTRPLVVGSPLSPGALQ